VFFNLSTFYFFFYVTIGSYIIYLPRTLENLGYTSLQIGIVFSTIPLVRFILPFLFLKKFKLTNKIFLFSLSISLLSAILFYFTIKDFYLFVFSNLLSGIGISLTLPYIELMTLEKLGNRYGKSRLYGSIGFIIISLVLARFIKGYQIILNFYLVATIIYIIFALLITKKEKKRERERKESNDKLVFSKNIGFWITIFLVQVSFGGYYNFFTIYELKNGISINIISYLWAFSVICEIIILYFQNYLLKDNNLMKIIRFSIIITIIRWLILYFLPTVVIASFISQALHAISFALYYTATVLYLYKIYPSNRLAMLFLSGISYGAGGLVGSLIAGITYGKNLFLISAIIALISFFTINTKKLSLFS